MGDYMNSFETSNMFDIVIPIKDSDWNIAKSTIPFLYEFMKPKKIIIVSSQKLEKEVIKFDSRLGFIREDMLIPKMNFENIKMVLKNASGYGDCTGWYFQQFIKLGYCRVCEDEYYLVWDADTIPVNTIKFFNEKNGKPLVNLKREYVDAYFKTLKNLLGINKNISESFIAEHMLINCEICKKMLDDIESNENFRGNNFWQKIIYATDYSKTLQAFSEFETYGNYCLANYPEFYEIRLLRTFRPGKDFVGDNVSNDILRWISKDFDTISFERWGTPFKESVYLCRFKILRKIFSFGYIVRFVCFIKYVQAILGNKNNKEVYYNLKKKQEFDYFWGTGSIYDKYREEKL